MELFICLCSATKGKRILCSGCSRELKHLTGKEKVCVLCLHLVVHLKRAGSSSLQVQPHAAVVPWLSSLPKHGVVFIPDIAVWGNLVSCRAAVSMLSLLRSRLMMAVFRLSSTLSRSSEKPGLMVPTFQLAERKTGSCYFFCFPCLPGAAFPVHLSSQSLCLSSKPPMKQVAWGRLVPY